MRPYSTRTCNALGTASTPARFIVVTTGPGPAQPGVVDPMDGVATGRLPSVAIAVAVASVLAVCEFLTGTEILLAGLIAVAPSLAAISGGRRSVIAVGGYVVGLILLVSWPDEIWWTRQQLLYLIAAVAITAVSAVLAHQRTLGEQRLQAVVAREGEVRRAGEEARRTAEYSRSLLEASLDPLVTISADGKITDVNAATAKVTGVPRTELIGTDFSDCFTDPKKARRGYEKVFAADSVTDYPLTIRHRDGRLTEVLCNAAVYRSAEGEVAGVFAAARDVTALKQAEASLRGLLESAPDAIIVVDSEGVIRIVNEQTEVLFGYSRQELLGQPIEVLVPEHAQSGHRGLRTSYLAAPERRPMGIGLQLNGRRRDGSEFPAEISLAPVNTPQGTYVSAAVRDVTFQHQVRVELIRANQAKSEFLSRMSHELRTPLNAILGFGQLLEMDELSTEQHDGVHHIIGAGRHLLDLINEILDISQVETGALRLSLEPVYIPDVTGEAIGMIRPLADHRSIHILENPRVVDAHVLADHQRFKQVLVNLLANAVKYNRESGEVRIETELLESGRIRLTISDTGYGMTEDDLGRLFQPFQRLQSAQSVVEGTGLGLALTKQLMTAMHGLVGVTSRVGEGSSFFVELPAVVPPSIDESVEAADDQDTTSRTVGQSMTVMYVEDNMSNIRLVEKVLARRPGISLIVAMEGRSAIRLAVEHLPDLILLDLHLPDVSGEDVLRELKGDPRTAGIPVVMLSADATPGRLKQLVKRDGAAGFLTKPFDIPGLFDVIDESTPAGNQPL